MTNTPIKDLFANDVARPIEEVIKVDQTDEEIIKFEIDEYVVTDAIARTTPRSSTSSRDPNKPREGVGVWVSGFFGSGKSSFAKMLGLALENRQIAGTPAGERFGARTNTRSRSCSSRSPRRSPIHAVISTSRPTVASAAATRRSPRSCTGCCSAVSATPATSTWPNWRSASKATAAGRVQGRLPRRSPARTGTSARNWSPSR